MTLTPEEKLMIAEFDEVIRNSKKLKSMTDTDGWQIFYSALCRTRRAALERILASSGRGDRDESVKTLIGYAQAMNYVVNLMNDLIGQGKVSEERKKEILHQIGEGALETRGDEERVVNRGLVGAV